MGVLALSVDPQIEEAFTLLDSRDTPETEDVSEAGEERPEEDSV
jgi:hypothetical protein